MPPLPHLAVICAAALVASACGRNPQAPPSSAADVLPAVEYVVRAFQTYPIVGLSELHGNVESQALFTSLVRDARFREAVSDIVVEFGNARYQDVVDRYVGGGNVPDDELSRVWRDTTQVTGIFNLPMYAEMLRRDAFFARVVEDRIRKEVEEHSCSSAAATYRAK